MTFKPRTYAELCQAMQHQSQVEINNYAGTIKAISLEDGSGRKFNIKLHVRDQQTQTKGYVDLFFVEN